METFKYNPSPIMKKVYKEMINKTTHMSAFIHLYKNLNSYNDDPVSFQPGEELINKWFEEPETKEFLLALLKQNKEDPVRVFFEDLPNPYKGDIENLKIFLSLYDFSIIDLKIDKYFVYANTRGISGHY